MKSEASHKSRSGARLITVMAAFAVSAGLLLGGCPQDVANLTETDSQRPEPGQDEASPADTGNSTQSTQPAPGQDAPTQGGELLEGPGFSLTLPSGLVLKEQDSPHPGVTFWRYYEDTLTLRGIAVGVNKPSGAGVTNLEEVSLRIKGAAQSATGDFLLVSRIAASGFFGVESEAAVGLLADGNVLVVQVASLDLSGVDELVASSLFTSIDLKDTDGQPLEQRWRETSTTLIAKTSDGLLVLSDLSVWSLFSDKTSAEIAEAASWNAGDSVFSQILSTDSGAELGELVHVGHWRPVEVFKVGVAVDSSITEIENGSVALSDGTDWIVGKSTASGWKVGDQVLRLKDGGVLSLIHASTGRVVTNPAQTIVGEGFSVNLPQRFLEEIDDLAPPAGAVFWKAFHDPMADVFYAVAVAAPDASGRSAPIEQLTFRIRGSVTTTSADFLVLARLAGAGFEGFEADVLIGLLADGRFLYVYLLADRIGPAEELSGFTLFTSVNLFDTDGRALEEEIAEDAEPVLVRGSNGMLVLDDLSVWTLTFSPDPSDRQEFNRWKGGG
ncbi:MAG: hypothetical protein IH986_14420 [Planctomycetes bacterium]|nr:hypothetical protein [Planctomycetota bacterium]